MSRAETNNGKTAHFDAMRRRQERQATVRSPLIAVCQFGGLGDRIVGLTSAVDLAENVLGRPLVVSDSPDAHGHVARYQMFDDMVTRAPKIVESMKNVSPRRTIVFESNTPLSVALFHRRVHQQGEDEEQLEQDVLARTLAAYRHPAVKAFCYDTASLFPGLAAAISDTADPEHSRADVGVQIRLGDIPALRPSGGGSVHAQTVHGLGAMCRAIAEHVARDLGAKSVFLATDDGRPESAIGSVRSHLFPGLRTLGVLDIRETEGPPLHYADERHCTQDGRIKTQLDHALLGRSKAIIASSDPCFSTICNRILGIPSDGQEAQASGMPITAALVWGHAGYYKARATELNQWVVGWVAFDRLRNTTKSSLSR